MSERPKAWAGRLPPLRSEMADVPGFEPILCAYLSDLRVQLEALFRARTVGDAEAAGRIVHQLKGSGTTYGYAAITETGLRCQVGLREGRSLVELSDALDALLATIDAALRGGGSSPGA